MAKLGIAIIGCGGITLQNHLPGLALCPDTEVVALCDTDATVLHRAGKESPHAVCSNDYAEIVKREDVHAVIIATPNALHAPIALAAFAAGKHVLCEKPIAMNFAEATKMVRAAEAAGVRHMTAFTYRFVPAFRYMAHLVKSGLIGQPYHFRIQRFQDWGQRALGWRQIASLAGTGEIGDMLSHRIDYAHTLMGRFKALTADIHRFHDLRDGQVSDLEDWVAMIARFESNATGVLESTKVATGRGESARSQDYCEINGSEASIVYFLGQKQELQLGRRGSAGLETLLVPKDFLVLPGSLRDPNKGDPLFTFRYDQSVEFINAIREQRPCVPSLLDGARAQAIIDATVASAREKRWIELPAEYRGL